MTRRTPPRRHTLPRTVPIRANSNPGAMRNTQANRAALDAMDAVRATGVKGGVVEAWHREQRALIHAKYGTGA